MKNELSLFFDSLAKHATFARGKIQSPDEANKAIAFEKRLMKLAATAGKSAKPRKARRPRRATATA